jgi:hypothetical protein
VLGSRDLAINLRGAAGTGKTATLQELHRGLTEARRSVVAVAPTASAVEELQKVGFPQAMTIARLLTDPQQRHELLGQVLVVDEAGMVSSKDMAELLELAKTKNARIVYSGDTAQIKSVSEGDALRVLERESNLKSVCLFEVQRQTNAEYKAAVEALRIHPAEGFSKLEAMGANCLSSTGSSPMGMRLPLIAVRAKRSTSKSLRPSAWRRICFTFRLHAPVKGSSSSRVTDSSFRNRSRYPAIGNRPANWHSEPPRQPPLGR